MEKAEKYDESKGAKLIQDFIETFPMIDISQNEKPLSSFKTLNDFFIRTLKPGARVIAKPADESVLVSGCDCRLMCFEDMSATRHFWVKGKKFSVASCLGPKLGPKYADLFGSMVVCRLAPQDYHRVHSPVTGTFVESDAMDGEYFTVNPAAVNHSRVNVFTENKRDATIIETKAFGKVAMVMVGACIVGSIVKLKKKGDSFKKGDCFGYFQFGGSTVLYFFEKGRVHFDDDIADTANRKLELLVQMGDQIGHKATTGASSAAAAAAPASKAADGVTAD